MGVKSFLEKCLMIASTSSLIHLTQWRANWTWWRTRSSSLYRLDWAISSRIWGPVYLGSISPDHHLFWSWEVHRWGLQSSIHRKAIVGKTPFCQLENHQFPFASRRRECLCPLLQAFSILKSGCAHISMVLSLCWHLNFNFWYLWGVLCAHRSSTDGQESLVLIQPVLPLSCRAWSRQPLFPNSKFPHLERGNMVLSWVSIIDVLSTENNCGECWQLQNTIFNLVILYWRNMGWWKASE